MFKKSMRVFAAAAATIALSMGASTAFADGALPTDEAPQPVASTESTLETAVPVVAEESVSEPVSEPAAPVTEEVAAPAPAAPAPVAAATAQEPVPVFADTVPDTAPATTTEDRAPPASEPLVAAVEECVGVGVPTWTTDPAHPETSAFTGVSLEWIGGDCNSPAVFTFTVDGQAVPGLEPVQFGYGDEPLHIDLTPYIPVRDGVSYLQEFTFYASDGAGGGESQQTYPWYADGYFSHSFDETTGVVSLTITGNLYVVDTEGDTYYSTDSFVLDKERTFTALPTIEGEAVAPWVLSPWTATPPDSDGDGVPDALDAFPNDPNESADADGDGVGDNADQCSDTPAGTEVNTDGCPVVVPPVDSDGDGVPDPEDAFPNDPNESADADGDGVGDNADQCSDTPAGTEVNTDGCPVVVPPVDTDGDGFSDVDESAAGSDPDNPKSTPLDRDGDGFSNEDELAAGSDPDDPNSTPNPACKGRGKGCPDSHPGLLKGKAFGLLKKWFWAWAPVLRR